MDERASVVLLADRRFLDHVAAAGASRGRAPPCLETRTLSRLLRTTPRLTGYGHGRSDAWRHERSRPWDLADALKGSHDVQREGHDTVVVRVCQITFRLGPDEF